MKQIYFLLAAFVLALAVVSCTEDENPVSPYNNIEDTKFIYTYSKDIRYCGEDEGMGCVLKFNFDGKIEKYIMVCTNPDKKEFEYVFAYDSTLAQALLDSIDILFTEYNFRQYPDIVPYDVDSNATYAIRWGELCLRTIEWRASKSEPLKKLTIEKFPSTGNYKAPENYFDFANKLDVILERIMELVF